MTRPNAEPIEDIIAELGAQVVDELREAAMTEMMPRFAAGLRGMTKPMAEAIVAQVLWYLEERDHADAQRVMKLLHLCREGAKQGMREGWLVGPKAQA